jgi:S1-C subfamily serine protease
MRYSPVVNTVDLLIAVLLVSAAVHGVLTGAAVQVFSFGGFWSGLVIGTAIAPVASHLFSGPFARAFVSTVAVFGLASLLGGVGRQLAVRIFGRFRHAKPFVAADAGLGAAIAMGATLLAVWIIAGLLANVPIPSISGGIHDSSIVRGLTTHLPPAPSFFARLRGLLDTAGFPDVFAGLEPGAGPQPPLPDDPAVRAAVAAAKDATVKVVGFGCGGIQTGSGFVATSDLVVTNAHVVAGIKNPTVQDRKGSHATTPVYFDPKLDIAILRTRGLAEAPLVMVRQEVARGDGGAVLGYPGGGPLRAGAAAVTARFNAVGRDIYDRSITTRRVYQIRAVVRPGNSGGPMVHTNGNVIGIVFSASTYQPDVAYALTSAEVAPLVDRAKTITSRSGTGPCTD